MYRTGKSKALNGNCFRENNRSNTSPYQLPLQSYVYLSFFSRNFKQRMNLFIAKES